MTCYIFQRITTTINRKLELARPARLMEEKLVPKSELELSSLIKPKNTSTGYDMLHDSWTIPRREKLWTAEFWVPTLAAKDKDCDLALAVPHA